MPESTELLSTEEILELSILYPSELLSPKYLCWRASWARILFEASNFSSFYKGKKVLKLYLINATNRT